MTRCAAVILALFTATAPAFGASDSQPTGKIIWSVTTGINRNLPETFAFRFKTPDGKHTDYASYTHDNFLLSRGSDFKDEIRKGGVQVLTVPAGEWDFYTYIMDGPQSAMSSMTLSPKDDFSVPITVTPGGTTYIGSYDAQWTNGKNIFGMGISTGGYFVVSDQGARDIAIAKRKDPAIGEVSTTIPDYKSMGLLFFQPAPDGHTLPSPEQGGP
jgi:hypothetical protein